MMESEEIKKTINQLSVKFAIITLCKKYDFVILLYNCVNNKMLKHEWLLTALICDLCTSQFQNPPRMLKQLCKIFFHA